MSVEGNVKTITEEMLRMVSTKNVVGEAIDMEDKVIVPITRFGVGFGTGMGTGKANNSGGGEGSGGGAGGGVGVGPVAVIVVFKGVKGPEGIKVLPLSTPGPVSKALGEIASTVADRMKDMKPPSLSKKGGEKEGTTPPAH